MSKKPPLFRWRYWTRFHLPNFIYLFLLTAAAAGSYWWIKHNNNETEVVEKHPELVDAFAETLTVNRTNKDGTVAFVLTTKNTLHYGNKDGAIEQLTLVATPTGQTAMTATANQGTWSEDANQIILSGDVKMTRAAEPESEEMILTSEVVTVNLYDGVASTDEPFKVTQGKSEMTGSGFTYDYQLRDLILNPKRDGRINAILYNHEIKK